MTDPTQPSAHTREKSPSGQPVSQSCPCHGTGGPCSCSGSGQDRHPPQIGRPIRGGRRGKGLGASSTGFQALCPGDAKHVNLASMEKVEVLGGGVMSWCPGLKRKRGREDKGTVPGHWPNRRGTAASLATQGEGSVLTASPLHLHIPELVSELSELLASERGIQAGECLCPWSKCWKLAALWGKLPA